MADIPIRKDIETLSVLERDALVKAFHLLQKNGPGTAENPVEDSFYVIAGYHGQPFRGAGYGNRDWWGGFCHHGNVLFPTWHRAYLVRLEEALRKVSGNANLALPYWNQLDAKRKVPTIFTDKEYTFEHGEKIKNPLHSYTLSQGFFDNLGRTVSNPDGSSTKKVDYSKPRDYETVRCPYSGLMGPDDKETTKEHNAEIDALGHDEVARLLNKNVKAWLDGVPEHKVPGLAEQYLKAAVEAPNYTVFSNTTSAAKWNDDHFERDPTKSDHFVVPLEQPHNGMHLAVGGYDMPDASPSKPKYPGANGDMGENDTAAFDPIFFFHHCFVDLVFWLWQYRHKAEKTFTIIPNYPGTSPMDSQGGTPGVVVDKPLDMETLLTPFPYKSSDVVDIEKLGYKYDYKADSLPQPTKPPSGPSSQPAVRVSGISRERRPGSFVVSIEAKLKNGDTQLVGVEPVFSRWHVPSCANCQNSLPVTIHKPLPPLEGGKSYKEMDLKVKVLENKALKDQAGEKKTEKTVSDITLDSELDPGPFIEVGGTEDGTIIAVR